MPQLELRDIEVTMTKGEVAKYNRVVEIATDPAGHLHLTLLLPSPKENHTAILAVGTWLRIEQPKKPYLLLETSPLIVLPKTGKAN